MHMNYLFIGRDPYPKEKAVGNLKRKLLKDDFSEFNFGVYYADNDNIKDVLSSASTMPFGSKHRVVVVKKVDKFTQKDLLALLAYLKKPAPHTALVLDTDKEIPRNESWREIPRFLRVTNFDKARGKSFEQWVKSEIDSLNKKISNDALRLLKESIGENDFLRLKNELNKLALFVGENPEISKRDVEIIVGKAANEDIFELVQTISQKNAKQSISIISDLLLRKVKPHEIVGLLAWHFRKIYIAERPGAFTRRELKDIIGLLLSTDLAIKRSRVNPKFALEIAVLRLCDG